MEAAGAGTKRRRGSDAEDQDVSGKRKGKKGSDDEVGKVRSPKGRLAQPLSITGMVARGGAATATSDSDDEIELSNVQSVVKVFCTHCEPNYALPWTTRSQNTSTSTGWVVRHKNKRWICTNAHSVDDAAVVEVRKRGDDKKFLATVDCIGPDCDLALLRVDDASFWKATPDCPTPKPVRIRKACPKLREEVTVVGYPVGGDNLSVTKGVVSRVDLQDYSNGSSSLLAVQIDAAINPGNSGGPVYDKKGFVVGVAFQTLDGDDTENLGYIIPMEVVLHFMEDYRRHSRYTGFGDVGFFYQKLENAALRQSLGMKKSQSGVLVKKTNKVCHCHEVLKPGDIVIKMSGKRIGNDATVTYRGGERIPFTYLASCKFIGETIDLEYYRDGQLSTAEYKVSREQSLVPSDPPSPPEYLVVGGLVLVPLSEKYLKSAFGESWPCDGPSELISHWARGMKESPDHQVIICTQVLASPITVGYQDISNEHVTKFNGTKIQNLRHLAELVDKEQGEYMQFGLSSEDCIVLITKEAKGQTSDILKKNMIQVDRRLAEIPAEAKLLEGDDDLDGEEALEETKKAVKSEKSKRRKYNRSDHLTVAAKSAEVAEPMDV